MHGNDGTQADDSVEESIPIGLSQRRREHSLGLIRLLLVTLLLRTSLTAHKTSQHYLDVAVDEFIPVRHANEKGG